MRIEEKEIGRIGLGTAPLAFSGRPVDVGVDVTLAALESGVRLIDTALAYTRPGIESFAEAVVARALRQWRGEQPIVATKGRSARDRRVAVTSAGSRRACLWARRRTSRTLRARWRTWQSFSLAVLTGTVSPVADAPSVPSVGGGTTSIVRTDGPHSEVTDEEYCIR